MSALEILGFATGAACVWLATRQNVWNFPIGIANNVAFLVLFATHGLYADAALQVLFGVIGVAGWWSWLRGGPRRTALGTGRLHVSDGAPGGPYSAEEGVLRWTCYGRMGVKACRRIIYPGASR